MIATYGFDSPPWIRLHFAGVARLSESNRNSEGQRHFRAVGGHKGDGQWHDGGLVQDEWLVSQRLGKLPVPALKDARVLPALMDVVKDRVAKPEEAPKHAKTAQKWAEEAQSCHESIRKSGDADALAFVEKHEAHEKSSGPK